MFNFETVWRKNHRLEGLITHYESKAKQDAFKIMQLQDAITNLQTELIAIKAENEKLKTTKSKKGTK